MAIRAFARASQFLYVIPFHFLGGSDANANIHLPSRDSPSPSSHLSGIGNHEFNDPIVSPSFESFIQSTMTEFHSPALSIAFMSENQTWARGYGYSSLPTNSSSSSFNSSLAVPVTSRTLFSTGSTTKSQVAAALALLISSSSNNLTWSTTVSSILPPDIFSLADEWSTSHITLIDILSHRTGYPRYDIGVLGTNVNETIHRMRYLRPSAEPRTKWQYSNEMYAVAGKVVEVLSGMELGVFLRENLWGPLGMTGTRLGLSPEDGNEKGKENFANEYFWNNDTEKFEGPLRRTEVTGEEGAGGVVSSVVDYMAYLRGMMGIQGSGRSKNNTEQQVLGDEARAALLGTHMFMSDRALNEDREFLTGPSWYGLGWSGDYVLGELAWHHNGGVGQMRTDLWFFPRLKKGFAVMQSATSLAIDVVANEAIYEILGTPKEERLPWAERFKEAAAQAEMIIAQIPRIMYPEEFTDPAPPKTPPSWSLADLVGKYRNPGFVDIDLSLVCNSTSRVSAPGSPAHPTRDENGCFLQTSIINTAGGRSGAELENVNGDKWLGWAFLVDMPASYSRPFAAIKVVFEGDQGRVTRGNFLLRTDTVTVLESFEKVE